MAKAKRKIGKIREVKVDLASYTYLINGVGGIGKTTTVCEIGQKEFGVDGFLLLTIGKEPEPEHIGNLWQETAEDWDDLEEIIDTLIEDKITEYPNLRMIGIDSVDEVFRLAEEKVVELHNKKVVNPTDKIETIGQAFGGFQRGNNKVVDLVTSTLFKLKENGISIFFIGHTKQKNKIDQLSEVEFEQITSNLDNKYYNCIKDKVNIVMCATYERKFTDVKTRKDAFTKTQKDIGVIESEKRIVHFRDDGFAIDTKSHLRYIVDKCELNSDLIIKELKEAMKKQSGLYHGELSEEELIHKAEKQREEFVAKEGKKVNDIEVKEQKLEQIKSNIAKLDMTQLQPIMSKYGVTSFEDASKIDMECLDEIIELIK